MRSSSTGPDASPCGWAARIPVERAEALGPLREGGGGGGGGGVEVLVNPDGLWVRGPAGESAGADAGGLARGVWGDLVPACSRSRQGSPPARTGPVRTPPPEGTPSSGRISRHRSGESPIVRIVDTIPGAVRFEWIGGGRIRRPGRRLASGDLPAGVWLPLTSWLAIEVPSRGVVPGRPATLPIRLVRDAGGSAAAPRAATLLELPTARWRRHLEIASGIRLAPLTHAVSEDGWALVRGTPLPSLEGTRYVSDGDLYVPCGWTWHPPVEARLLVDVLEVTPGDVLLLRPPGYGERVPASSFVPVSRSSVPPDGEDGDD